MAKMAPQGRDGDFGDQLAGHPKGGPLSNDNDRARNKRYRMSAELAALGADFLVLNDAGEHEFRFNGQAMSDDDTIRLEDMEGRVLYTALAHAARKQPRIVIVDGAGTKIGSVIRQPVSPLRDRFTVEVEDGLVLTIDGNVPKHEYSILAPPGRVAEVSQKWFRARGSYGVEIVPGQRDALLLTTIVVIDQMIHEIA
jgi:uncharacterized protein YxjI